jgi:hypothetical protein
MDERDPDDLYRRNEIADILCACCVLAERAGWLADVIAENLAPIQMVFCDKAWNPLLELFA